jgi:Radical SAM superfamily
MSDVCLIFPPLVESNFGSYFPSTAVLAAYLEAEGIRTTQVDLNEEFADYLLADETLQAIVDRRLPQVARLAQTSRALTAARFLLRHRDRLYDDAGRHDFESEPHLRWLLHVLSIPFLSNPSAADIAEPGRAGSPAATMHREFFAAARIAERLPPQTRLVGLSVPMGPQLVPALLLAAHLKAARPGVRIILGGPTISLSGPGDLATLLSRNPSVDAAVKFDGELPLAELARQTLDGRWDPASVRGVSAVAAGVVKHNPPGRGLNVNSLPYPRYEQTLLDRLADPVLGIVQARGCYWGKCDYCDFVELYDGSPPFRARTPTAFMAEIDHQIATYGIRRFAFITESLPPAFARKVCTEIVRRGLDIGWVSFAMVDRRFDRDLLELIAQAGCRHLIIGLETTVTRVLKLVRKSSDREENFRFLRDARDARLNLWVNIIPDLPSTTYAEALQALSDLEELSDCVSKFAVFPFEATRSSRVGSDPERFGLRVEPSAGTNGIAQYAMNHLGNVDPAMTDAERREIYRRFFDLERSVARRDIAGIDEHLSEVPSPHVAVRLAVEDLDFLEDERGLACTHVGTRKRTIIPSSAVSILRPQLNGEPFTLRELSDRCGESAARHIMAGLLTGRLLTVAPAAEKPVPVPVLLTAATDG